MKLAQKEKSLNDREKSLNERVATYENRSTNLERIAGQMTGMPPAAAVERLVRMDDQDVIDIFRAVDQLAARSGQESIVPYWLSLMPADRAATLQRKMIE